MDEKISLKKEHDLKIDPINFQFVITEQKKSELRVDDRHYEVGDTLKLNEWINDGQRYTDEVKALSGCSVT